MIHIDIKDDKIWIQYDGTEVGVPNELATLGVPKSDIMLAYLSSFARQHTEFPWPELISSDAVTPGSSWHVKPGHSNRVEQQTINSGSIFEENSFVRSFAVAYRLCLSPEIE